MSDTAVRTLYKRTADGRCKGRHVLHGWRAAFSTLMNEWVIENGTEADRLLIDLMLAHPESRAHFGIGIPERNLVCAKTGAGRSLVRYDRRRP